MKEQIAKFAKVRSLQSQPHPSGRPALSAFLSGRCHTMALALQEAGGGDLVVITPKDKPDYLIHAGVYRDNQVADAHGYVQAHDWAGMWRTMSMEFDASFRRVNPAELMAMIPERGGGEEELAAARPLAQAITEAADIDKRAWRSAPPAGSFGYVKDGDSPEEAFTKALALPERAFVKLIPSPSRAEMQANAARMAGLHR